MNAKRIKKILSYFNLGLVVFTLLMMGITTAYFIQVSGLPHADSNLMFIRPCYYVVLLCGGLVILKEAWRLIAALKNESKQEKEALEASVEIEKGSETTIAKLLAFFDKHKEITLMAFAFGYVAVMKTFGYMISTFVFMVIILRLVGALNKKWGSILLVSAIVTALLYVAFVVCLQVALPKGFIGI